MTPANVTPFRRASTLLIRERLQNLYSQAGHPYTQRLANENRKARQVLTSETLAEIDRLQSIQKTNPPTSEAWKTASKALAPLFSTMAILEPLS